jgi:hypothetical protein
MHDRKTQEALETYRDHALPSKHLFAFIWQSLTICEEFRQVWQTIDPIRFVCALLIGRVSIVSVNKKRLTNFGRQLEKRFN